MNKYKIDITRTLSKVYSGTLTIKADSIEDAYNKAKTLPQSELENLVDDDWDYIDAQWEENSIELDKIL